MAYSVVPTVNTGDLWTAANHNTYIRDNFAAGVPDIFTTKGDLAVATGADAASRLAAGSDGYILEALASQSTGLIWRSPIWCEGYQSGSQSISTGTVTIVNFGSEQDPYSVFTTGASAKFTAPYAGVYLFYGRLGFQDYVPALGSVAGLYFYGNGALWRTLDSRRAEQSTNAWRVVMQGMYIWALSASDYMDLRVDQNSGSSQSTWTNFTYFYICRIK